MSAEFINGYIQTVYADYCQKYSIMPKHDDYPCDHSSTETW